MPSRPRPARRAVVAVVAAVATVVAAGCTSASSRPTEAGAPTSAAPVAPAPTPSTSTSTSISTSTSTSVPAPPPPPARPAWLGTRPLPLRPDGFGQVLPTPPELVDRRLPPPDLGLPPPPADGSFAGAVSPVPPDVGARSTWSPACPVDLGDLRYVTVTFWGFDHRSHTGELLVHQRVADDLVGVFRRLFDARFPIEELRITRPEELDAAPTGDGGTSGAFVCRAVTGGSSWSEHAKGLAVDLNPFHNPYLKGDVVVPELASAYLDRDRAVPGMIRPGDEVTAAFADIGWSWGGAWRSSKDWMHFSASGR